jgi:hypothetical protein
MATDEYTFYAPFHSRYLPIQSDQVSKVRTPLFRGSITDTRIGSTLSHFISSSIQHCNRPRCHVHPFLSRFGTRRDVIQQEFRSMAHPNRFQQSIEIFVIECRKGFTSRGPDGQCGVKDGGNILTAQKCLPEETIVITSVNVGGNGREE